MSNQRLHPNLARIAAEYDDIFAMSANGQITGQEAARRIRALQARDDDGTWWSIDPTSGHWRKKTVYGEWVPGQPPEYGLALPTPHHVSGTDDPYATRMRFDEVDEDLLLPPDSLAGATRRRQVTTTKSFNPSRKAWLVGGAVAVALVLTFAGVRAVTAQGNDTLEPTPTPTVTVIQTPAPSTSSTTGTDKPKDKVKKTKKKKNKKPTASPSAG